MLDAIKPPIYFPLLAHGAVTVTVVPDSASAGVPVAPVVYG
jgi:hypothetical protein